MRCIRMANHLQVHLLVQRLSNQSRAVSPTQLESGPFGLWATKIIGYWQGISTVALPPAEQLWIVSSWSKSVASQSFGQNENLGACKRKNIIYRYEYNIKWVTENGRPRKVALKAKKSHSGKFNEFIHIRDVEWINKKFSGRSLGSSPPPKTASTPWWPVNAAASSQSIHNEQRIWHSTPIRLFQMVVDLNDPKPANIRHFTQRQPNTRLQSAKSLQEDPWQLSYTQYIYDAIQWKIRGSCPFVGGHGRTSFKHALERLVKWKVRSSLTKMARHRMKT